MVALPEQPASGSSAAWPTTAVRFGAMNWVGEFRHPPEKVFRCGVKVVIQTGRGMELGEQISLCCPLCARSISREQVRAYLDNSGPEFYRLNCGRILRQATAQDIDEHRRLNSRVREDLERCALLAAQLNLDMKVVTAEHLLGGERIVFYFRAAGRIDFRQLVRQLAQHYQTRIEMRQVGARDEARLVADYEICGRECCCKNFLKKLQPVSMKMAKLQKSTLDPSKVSGRCGRLRCCLRYEHAGYQTLARSLPRLHSRVQTARGRALVLDRQILTQLVLVRLERDGREIVVPAEEIVARDLPPPQTAAAGPRPEVASRPTRFVADGPAETEASREQVRPPPFSRGREPGEGQPARPLRQPPAEGGTAAESGKSEQQRARGLRRRRRRRPRPGRGRLDQPPDAGQA